jgi:hypothetical protein
MKTNTSALQKKEILLYDIYALLDHDSNGYLIESEIPVLKNTKTSEVIFGPKMFVELFVNRNSENILKFEKFNEKMIAQSEESIMEIRKKVYLLGYRWIPNCMVSLFLYFRDNSSKNALKAVRSSEEIIEKDYISAFIGLFNATLEVVDYVSDVILLFKIYFTAQVSDGDVSFGYTVLFVVRLLALFSHYLMAYSSGLQLLLNKGHYDPSRYQKYGCFKKLFLLMFFTCISPAFFALLTIFDMFYHVLRNFIMIFVPIQWGFKKATAFLDSMIYKIGFDKNEYLGFLEQKSIAMLMFEDIPVLIFDTLMIAGVIYAPNIIKESYELLVISYCSTIVNVIIKFTMLYIKANYLKEDYLIYALGSMKARFGWIPFFEKLKDQEMGDRITDFHLIRCPIPFITRLVGFYQEFSFEFSELNVRHLAEAVHFIQNSGRKTQIQEIAIGRCLKNVSIQVLGQLLSSTPRDVVILNLNGINWKDSISFTRQTDRFVFSPNGKWVSLTPLRESLFIICAKTEDTAKKYIRSRRLIDGFA